MSGTGDALGARTKDEACDGSSKGGEHKGEHNQREVRGRRRTDDTKHESENWQNKPRYHCGQKKPRMPNGDSPVRHVSPVAWLAPHAELKYQQPR